jgi:outer membrane protein OmpA-like peptidoglycan-associated protein
MSKNPTYKLPDTPAFGGVYIPNEGLLHGVQTTAGLTWYFGKKAEPLPEVRKVEAVALGSLVPGALSAGSGTLCQGRPITIRANGISDPAGRSITYKWRVNGQPMGGNAPELTFTPDRSGAYNIELDLEAPNTEGMATRSAKSNSLAINVQPYAAPTITGCQAVPTQLKFGDMANLSANATGSACSTITTNWTVTEGTVASPTMARTQFDSKTVRFEQGGKIQSKTVTATAKVTDDRGATASCDATIKIDYIPNAVRFSDVVFSKNSSRVNNCGKRILLNELAPKAADPDYEIVLVGHIDQDEVAKGNKPTTLDMQRVMNAVAVLTGGSGTCANVDPSRIKLTWVGTEQVSDMQPGLCGTSTRAATEERSSSKVSTADQNRRVEVWLVPKGTKLPDSFKEPKQLDDKMLKKLGCPK